MFGLFTLTACVSVRVEPLTGEIYPPNNSDQEVQWLQSEPQTPHLKLARIIATSQTVDEDLLRQKIPLALPHLERIRL